jgi:hypothetical protein
MQHWFRVHEPLIKLAPGRELVTQAGMHWLVLLSDRDAVNHNMN